MNGPAAPDLDVAATRPSVPVRSRSRLARVVRVLGVAVAGWLVIQVVLTGALATLIFLRPGPTVWHGCQPETVEYEDGVGYCLAVVERRTLRSFVLPYLDHHDEIWVGRGQQPSYGYVVDHSFRGDVDDLDGSVAEWERDGVTFVEPSGQRLFVPADAFTGGR